MNELPTGMRVVAWPANAPPHVLADHREAGQAGQGIIWIDLVNVAAWDVVADALDEMELPGYDRALLGHVLQGPGPDQPGAEGVPWYDETVAATINAPGGPSYLRAFGLEADIHVDIDQPPWVFQQEVRFLVSNRWLITHRLDGRASNGVHAMYGEPFAASALEDFARRRWGGFVDPPDLALLFLRAVVDTYADAIAALDTRVRMLQQAYLRPSEGPGKGSVDDAAYREKLLQVGWVVDGLSGALTTVARPGRAAPEAWFDVVSSGSIAVEAQDLIERAEVAVRRQREDLREGFSLIAAIRASEEVTLARSIQQASAEEQDRARRFETGLQYVAFGLLVPTLVATVLGALPAIYDDCPTGRFITVVGATLASMVLSVLGVHEYRKRTDEGKS